MPNLTEREVLRQSAEHIKKFRGEIARIKPDSEFWNVVIAAFEQHSGTTQPDFWMVKIAQAYREMYTKNDAVTVDEDHREEWSGYWKRG